MGWATVDERCITAARAAVRLKTSEKMVYRLIKHGYLSTLKKAKRTHQILLSGLEAFEAQYPVLPQLPPEKQYDNREPGRKQYSETPEFRAERLCEARSYAARRGGECLSSAYVHSQTPLVWRCENGHTWERVFYRVVKNGVWCVKCERKCKGMPFIPLPQTRGSKPSCTYN